MHTGMNLNWELKQRIQYSRELYNKKIMYTNIIWIQRFSKYSLREGNFGGLMTCKIFTIQEFKKMLFYIT